jgi:hypothetical protein
MNGLAKRLGLVGAAATAMMMFASPAFAATNTKAADHAPSNVLAHQMAATETVHGQTHIITPNGTSAPTSFWNLSGGNDYPASFSDVSNAGIYTNYYFDSNAGTLYVKNIKLYGYNASSVPCEIDLWDKTTGQELYYSSFTTDTGNIYEIHYSGLNTNDQYYVGIRSDAINETISGQFDVSWTA